MICKFRNLFVIRLTLEKYCACGAFVCRRHIEPPVHGMKTTRPCLKNDANAKVLSSMAMAYSLTPSFLEAPSIVGNTPLCTFCTSGAVQSGFHAIVEFWAAKA